MFIRIFQFKWCVTNRLSISVNRAGICSLWSFFLHGDDDGATATIAYKLCACTAHTHAHTHAPCAIQCRLCARAFKVRSANPARANIHYPFINARDARTRACGEALECVCVCCSLGLCAVIWSDRRRRRVLPSSSADLSNATRARAHTNEHIHTPSPSTTAAGGRPATPAVIAQARLRTARPIYIQS